MNSHISCSYGKLANATSDVSKKNIKLVCADQLPVSAVLVSKLYVT